MSGPVDQEVRDLLVGDLTRSYLVEASAGTGKTALIVGRAVALVETGAASITQIAMITFGEAAAAELGERVRARIPQRIAELRNAAEPPADAAQRIARLEQADADIDRAPISTIHAFAASLLRSRAIESGIDPRFEVLDEQRADLLFEEVWRARLERSEPTERDALARVRRAGVRLDDLRTLAKFVLDNRDGLVGTPRRTDAPDAAAEATRLAEFAERQLAEVRTLCPNEDDKLFLEFLAASEEARKVARGTPSLQRKRLIAGVKNVRGGRGKIGNWKGGRAAMDAAIDAWDVACGRFRALLGRHLAGEVEFWIGGFVRAYEARKRRDGLLDFQDLLLHARTLLAQPGIADGARRQFPYVLVDEFQDTDPLQIQIVALLAGEGSGANWESRRPVGGGLFLVGDPKQSIYRFRRADIALYRRARAWIRDMCGVDSDRTIAANFRSRPGITDFVNALFGTLLGSDDHEDRYVPLQPVRDEEHEPAVVALVAPDGADGPPDDAKVDERRRYEAEAIGAEVAAALAEGRWAVTDRATHQTRPARAGDIALLLRGFSDVAYYEDALREHRVPVATVGGRRYHGRAEVSWFGALLRAVESPHDEIAVVAALRSPFFGFSDAELVRERLERNRFDPLGAGSRTDDLGAALQRIAEWHRARFDRPLESSVREILEGSGALALTHARAGGEQGVQNLLKVIELARVHERDGGSFRSFVRWLEQARDEEIDDGDAPLVEGLDDAVRVMTIHKSKGLEFPIVILADLYRTPNTKKRPIVAAPPPSAGADPGSARAPSIEFALSGDQPLKVESAGFVAAEQVESRIRNEERLRLLYVATTRARDWLVISFLGGRPTKGTFGKDLVDAGAAPDMATASGAAGEARVQLSCGATVLARVAGRAAERTAERTAGRGSMPAAIAQPAIDEASREAATPGSTPPECVEAGEATGSAPPDSRDVSTSQVPGAPAGTFDVWLAARRSLIARASIGTPIVTVTELAALVEPAYEDADVSDAERAERLVEHRGAVQELSPREIALRFGRAVHGVLEDVDFGMDAALIGPLAKAKAEVEGISGRADAIVGEVQRALGTPLLARARASRWVQRELDVAYFDSGVLVEGRIDLVFEAPDGTLVIVDYKTDRVGDETQARAAGEPYRVQLAVYADALARATGRTVAQMVLLYTALGLEVPLVPSDAIKASIGARMSSLASAAERT